MKNFYYRYKREINTLLTIVLFFLVAFVFFKFILEYILPFFIAFLLSLILNPLADLIQNKFKTPRWLASIICIFLVLFIIFFSSTNIVSRIFSEAQDFFKNLPNLIDDFYDTFDDITERYTHLFNLIPETFQKSINQMATNLVSSITSSLSSLVKNHSVTVVAKISQFIMVFILSIISSFFFINDRDKINKAVLNILPTWLEKNFGYVRTGVFQAIGGYLKAQSIIMCIIATIAIIGFSILKYPYAFFVGLILAFVDALPIFGSGFILWPWIAINLLEKDYSMAFGLAIIYGVVFIMRQVLEPKILGKQIGIHPLLTLMSIYIGLKVFGALGFILGPAILIIIKTLLEANNLSFKKNTETESVPVTENSTTIAEINSNKNTNSQNKNNVKNKKTKKK